VTFVINVFEFPQVTNYVLYGTNCSLKIKNWTQFLNNLILP